MVEPTRRERPSDDDATGPWPPDPRDRFIKGIGVNPRPAGPRPEGPPPPQGRPGPETVDRANAADAGETGSEGGSDDRAG